MSVSAIRAPLWKNTRIAGKMAFFIIISKQNNRHKQKKEDHQKKTEIRNTTTIQTPTTGKSGVPKCKKLGFGKGDAMELALKESNKLKKGRKKKEDRTESKRKQNVRSKGFDELPRGSRTAATTNDYSSVFVFAAILVLCAGQIPQLCREPHRFRWLVSVFQVILT